LVVKVHRHDLEAEIGPDAALGDALWQDRYRSIRDLSVICMSTAPASSRFFCMFPRKNSASAFGRIDEPHKNWKLTSADIEERKFWKQYRHAYEVCLEATSTKEAPWYVVPADDKANARLIVSQIVLDALEGLNPQYPEISLEKRAQLQAIRALLEAEAE
jgi:polyphosphate kinase 2 (PPK2 family)